MQIHLFLPTSLYLSISSYLPLSTCPSLPTYLSLPVHLFLPTSLYLSISSYLPLSTCPSLPTYLSLPIHLFLPTYPPTYPYLALYLSLYLSISYYLPLSTYPSLCLHHSLTLLLTSPHECTSQLLSRFLSIVFHWNFSYPCTVCTFNNRRLLVCLKLIYQLRIQTKPISLYTEQLDRLNITMLINLKYKKAILDSEVN